MSSGLARIVMVRYKVKPEKAAENQRFVEAVFKELNATKPSGLHYATFRLPDGLSFMHIAALESTADGNPLQRTAAFQAFQEAIEDRCEEQPVVTELKGIGSYAFFGA